MPKEKGRSRRVSNEEIDAITLATQSKLLGSVLILAIETAMRRAEISGIEHKHINLSKRTLTLLETKNGETRIVPLSTKAIQVIQSLPRNISGKLFNLKADSITQSFARAITRAKAKYKGNDDDFLNDLRFYDLRH